METAKWKVEHHEIWRRRLGLLVAEIPSFNLKFAIYNLQ